MIATGPLAGLNAETAHGRTVKFVFVVAEGLEYRDNTFLWIPAGLSGRRAT